MDDTYAKLRVLAETFGDAQEFRKAIASKLRSSTVVADDIGAALDVYKNAEHQLSIAMRRELRAVAPKQVLAWQKQAPGVGEHLLARLLGAIGDPYVAHPARWVDTPDGPDKRVLMAGEPYVRNVGKLRAYCGVGDPARKKRKGMSAEDALALGNPKAKMLLRLIAESCLKQPGTRYELVYRKWRETYDDRVHVGDCPQCRAKEGDPWEKGHKHGAALRKVAITVLGDLWDAAREAHA